MCCGRTAQTGGICRVRFKRCEVRDPIHARVVVVRSKPREQVYLEVVYMVEVEPELEQMFAEAPGHRIGDLVAPFVRKRRAVQEVRHAEYPATYTADGDLGRESQPGSRLT